MAELQDTDQFLVNRSDSTYQLEAQNLMAELLDDDLMIVNREGVTYKATGQEIKESLDNAVPVTIETVVVTEDEPGVNARYTNKTFTTAVNCDVKAAEPIVYGLKAKSEGSLVVQAKSSVITGVTDVLASGWDQSEIWSSVITGTTNTGDYYEGRSVAALCFTGSDAEDAASKTTGIGSFIDITGLSLTATDTLEVRLTKGTSSASWKNDISGANITTTSIYGPDGNKFINIPVTGPVTGFRIAADWSGAHAHLLAIKVNGKRLVDTGIAGAPMVPQTSLSLTDDTGLSEFSPGDDIVQNGSGTPVSSAITNISVVNTPDYPSQTTNVNNMQSFGSISKVFDGSLETNVQLDPNTGITAWAGFSISPAITGSSIRLYCRSTTTGNPTTDNIRINGSKVYSAALSYSWLPIDQTSVTKIEGMTFGGGGTYLAAIEVDGSVLIANATLNTLTLTDDTNLANFRAGDVVQAGNSYGSDGTLSGTTIIPILNSPIPPPVDAFDGNPTTWWEPFGGGTDGIDPCIWTPTIPIPYNNKVEFLINTNEAGMGWHVNNNNVEANNSSTEYYTVATGSGTIFNFGLYNSNASYMGTIRLLEVRVDGIPLIDGQVLVTAIDEDAPSITTDGGSWSGTDGTGDPVGDASVTGLSFTASGKVSSFDAAATPPTLTVSASDGRWLITEADYQEDLKLNKVAQSPDYVEVDDAELFCIFDAEGNISDVSGTDPGYRDMVSAGTTFESFNLKFPALFSNGKTPDQTLPSGASLCVDVEATNITGVDFDLDTCVTPEDPDPEPQADMHGLRFDSARMTSLEGTNTGSDTFTFSCWVKSTGNQRIIGNPDFGISNMDTYIDKLAGGTVRFGDSGTSIIEVANVLTDNKWQQLVVSHGPSGAVMYVDGESVGTGSYKSSLKWSSVNIRMGVDARGIAGSDAYLSEVYYVAGQALPPETFGYDYENQGKWAPLDSAVIKQNIIDAKTYDGPGYNNNEVWSTKNNSPSSDVANLFDGDLRSYTIGRPFLLNPTVNIPVTSKVEFAGGEFGYDEGRVEIDGTWQPTVPSPPSNTWATLYEGSGNITNVEFGDKRGPTQNGAGAALKVDGKILVDPRNTSQVWSSAVTGPSERTPANAFDGEENTFSYTITESPALIFNIPSAEQSLIGVPRLFPGGIL